VGTADAQWICEVPRLGDGKVCGGEIVRDENEAFGTQYVCSGCGAEQSQDFRFVPVSFAAGEKYGRGPDSSLVYGDSKGTAHTTGKFIQELRDAGVLHDLLKGHIPEIEDSRNMMQLKQNVGTALMKHGETGVDPSRKAKPWIDTAKIKSRTRLLLIGTIADPMKGEKLSTVDHYASTRAGGDIMGDYDDLEHRDRMLESANGMRSILNVKQDSLFVGFV